MKLELKNIKHANWASEETQCYDAVLYVDGDPFLMVSNEERISVHVQYSIVTLCFF